MEPSKSLSPQSDPWLQPQAIILEEGLLLPAGYEPDEALLNPVGEPDAE
jgi:hypothetical protein